jgi:hypothetical protein
MGINVIDVTNQFITEIEALRVEICSEFVKAKTSAGRLLYYPGFFLSLLERNTYDTED